MNFRQQLVTVNVPKGLFESNFCFSKGSPSSSREVPCKADDHRTTIPGSFQDHLVSERGPEDQAGVGGQVGVGDFLNS